MLPSTTNHHPALYGTLVAGESEQPRSICLVSHVSDWSQWLQTMARGYQMALSADHGLEPEQVYGECRIDLLPGVRPEQLLELGQIMPLKQWLVTTRCPSEGGVASLTLAERQAFWLQALQLKIGYLDIELSTLERHPSLGTWLQTHKRATTNYLLSYHNLLEVPDIAVLEQQLAKAHAWQADVVKLALTPQNTSQQAALLTWLHNLPAHLPVPLLCLTMGDMGNWLRWLQPRFPKLCSFVYVKVDAHGTAPGQASLAAILAHGRYLQQQADWPLYGVIGAPVHHSLSPTLHHSALAAAKLPGLWLHCHVPPPLGPWLEQVARKLGMVGLAVTMPHKREALQVASSHSEWAALIGAANTLLWRGPEQGWYADNTDGPAIQHLLLQGLAVDNLQGQNVLVLGTGGVARAAAAAIAKSLGKPLIAGRNLAAAQALAAVFGGQALTLADVGHSITDCAAIVQCTSVGMAPQQAASPLSLASLPKTSVLLETIYWPQQTTLMAAYARQAPSTHIVSGLRLLLQQACYQFEHFTLHRPAIAVMEQAIGLN